MLGPFPNSLILTPVSRWPTTLPEETIRAVLEQPVARGELGASNLGQPPEASIIVVAYNNLAFNRLCLESVLANTATPPFELIVVDNGSTDGTVEYLRELAAFDSRVKPIFNATNRGFAPANNQGLAAARCELLVLLNNDTIVPPDWLSDLTEPLANPAIGLVGPVTNRAGNEAEIPTRYQTYGELVEFAGSHRNEHRREHSEVERLILFCAAMRRDVYEKVGLLDEQFEVGMFEDDDFSFRVRQAGYQLLLVEDAFVHHFGQASLGKLAATGEYGPLFQANRQRWEEKWGRAWEPYPRRENPEYDAAVCRLQQLAAKFIAPHEITLIVSRGDDALVAWPGWRGWHFPRTDSGEYSGFHPADSAAAIAHLEQLRSQGARWFVLPAASAWWWDYYGEFREQLLSRHELVADEATAGRIFRLSNE